VVQGVVAPLAPTDEALPRLHTVDMKLVPALALVHGLQPPALPPPLCCVPALQAEE